MIDRKKMRENLIKRTEESAARSDGDSNQKYLKSDEKLPMWSAKPTKGEPHIIDIIPFVAGDNFPLDRGVKVVRKGDDAYVVPVAVHKSIGFMKEDIVCPARNYGKPCPICEDIDKRSRAGEEWDTLQTVAPRNRCIYNILVMTDAKTEAKGIQIWETSDKYSEKEFKSLAKNPRGGGYIPFQHPDQGVGKSIVFEVEDNTFWTPKGFKFIERDYDIPDEILEKAYCLDELINLLPYEVIKAKYYGTSTESKVEDDVPVEIPVEETHSIRRRETIQKVEEVKEVKESECPFNGKFGIDIDKLPQCSKDCSDEKYQLCAREADRIEEEKKAEAKKSSLRRRG